MKPDYIPPKDFRYTSKNSRYLDPKRKAMVKQSFLEEKKPADQGTTFNKWITQKWVKLSASITKLIFLPFSMLTQSKFYKWGKNKVNSIFYFVKNMFVEIKKGF